MKSLVVFRSLLMLTFGFTGFAAVPKFAPSGPIANKDVTICHEGDVKFVADVDNMCWYWECVDTIVQNRTQIQLLPRRCALGSKMDYSYKFGLSNPCSINFNTKISFECTRADEKAARQEPECFKNYPCHNNGTATYLGSICWCECTEEWRGNFDCSEPTSEYVERNATANSTECFQKEPPCDLARGCENNGVCHNQCGDFWCECPVPFTNGKRCEGFSCDANPCKNGGTCNRLAGIHEVSRCICLPGFYGFLCEYGQARPATMTRRPVRVSSTQQLVTASATHRPVTETDPPATFRATQPLVTFRANEPPVTDRTTQPPVTFSATQPPVTFTATQPRGTEGIPQP